MSFDATDATALQRPSDVADDGHRFLFIGGLHRSGTSVLHRCLADHGEVSGFADTGMPQDEGQFLQTVYAIGRTYGGPGIYGFSPAAHLTEAYTPATGTSDDALFAQWKPHWDLSRRVLSEKTPQNLLMSRFLQQQFPRSHFVFILRHPVANAMASAKWAHASLSTLVCHWLHCHRLMLEDIKHLNSYQIFRYEDFIAAPEAGLRAIFEAVDLAPDISGRAVDARGNQTYERAWCELVAETRRPLPAIDRSDPKAVRRRDRLDSTLTRLNDLLRRFGYHRRAQLVRPDREVTCLLHHLEPEFRAFGFTLDENGFGLTDSELVPYTPFGNRIRG